MDDGTIDSVIAAFTSLDDLETTVQNLLQTTEAQQHIHRSTEEIRTALILAFANSQDAGLKKRAERLANCCKWPLLILRNDGKPAISLQRCKDRLCPVCSKLKAMSTNARVKEAVSALPSKRFVTLTGLSTGKTLKTASTNITDGFRELRRSRFWKEHVTAGVWTKEIKPGKEEGTWNVHLHMIVSGKYMPQDQLSSAWMQATGDSFVVDIRAVYDGDKAAGYVTKYISKPGNFNRWSADEIEQFAIATKGERLIGTFGKLHSTVKLDEEKPEGEQLSGRSISVHKLQQLAAEKLPAATKAIELLARCGGFYSAIVCSAPPSKDEKISEIDLASLGQALLECMETVQLRDQPPPEAAEIEVEPTNSENLYQQLELLDTSRGFAYR